MDAAVSAAAMQSGMERLTFSTTVRRIAAIMGPPALLSARFCLLDRRGPEPLRGRVWQVPQTRCSVQSLAVEPTFASLIGAEPDSVEALFDYGYRAAWSVVAEGRRYLVKRDDRPAYSEREAAANRHAAANGIPTPALVATRGEPVQFMAFRWVDGEPPGDLAGVDLWRDAGAMLKRIHELPTGSHGAPWGSLEQFEGELAWMVERDALTVGEAQSALVAARGALALLSDAEPVFIHGDCQRDHFIIDAQGAIAAVIDWADAGTGYPEMDLAVIALSAEPATFEAVLEAYRPSVGLRERLPRTLPAFQAIRAALSYRWLETHGYPGYTWPIERVRALSAGS